MTSLGLKFVQNRSLLQRLNQQNCTKIRHATSSPSGAILPEPKRPRFGFLGIICGIACGLFIGAAISKNIANFLEENDLFVPSDDDDDDDWANSLSRFIYWSYICYIIETWTNYWKLIESEIATLFFWRLLSLSTRYYYKNQKGTLLFSMSSMRFSVELSFHHFWWVSQDDTNCFVGIWICAIICTNLNTQWIHLRIQNRRE